MAQGFQTAVDQALLLSEWRAELESCPVCGVFRNGDSERGGDPTRPAHAMGCAMDAALSERGYATFHDRDIARSVIVSAKAETIPPP